MNSNINGLHKILLLQGPLNDIIFLEHFYLISILKSYLLTKKGEILLCDFLERYTSSIEEKILLIYYLLETESSFLLYFKEPLKVIENYVSLLEKNNKNFNAEFCNIQSIIKKYSLLYQEEKQNESLYETMEMDNRSILLNYPKQGLKTCFIVDAAVYQVLIRKQPFEQLMPLLHGEGVYYALGSVYKLLCDLQTNLTLKKSCTYQLQDFTYLKNIVENFSSYVQDDVSNSLLELINVLLENTTQIFEPKLQKKEGKVLDFERRRISDKL